MDRDAMVHLVSGAVGGTCGAVLTCPLEVVKTRLQSSASGLLCEPPGAVQGSHQSYLIGRGAQPSIWACLRQIFVQEGPRALFKGLGPNLVGVAPSRAIYFWSYSGCKIHLNGLVAHTRKDTPLIHMVSAAFAGAASSCTTNPLWVIKTRLQLDNEKVPTSVNTVIRKILQESGYKGFWKGLSASFYGISETVIHFVIYEALKKRLAESKYDNRVEGSSTFKSFMGYMGCGALSKTVATCLAYPHEVVRTRLREPGSKYSSFWQTLALVYREEGKVGLYRGLLTNLVRQIPNTAIMMASYEFTVQILMKYI